VVEHVPPIPQRYNMIITILVSLTILFFIASVYDAFIPWLAGKPLDEASNHILCMGDALSRGEHEKFDKEKDLVKASLDKYKRIMSWSLFDLFRKKKRDELQY
jgi:hypothetical protein